MEKTSIPLNKPRFIGAAILALSKTVMYDFHYSYMAKKAKPDWPVRPSVLGQSLGHLIRADESDQMRNITIDV